MNNVLEDMVEYEVKQHLYIKKFMEYVNKRARKITFLGIKHLSDKKVDIREEFAKFLKQSGLYANDEVFNQEVVDLIRCSTQDKKFETDYMQLYEAGLKCYNESINVMTANLERRPSIFKPIYMQYFPNNSKDKGMGK